MIEIVTLFLGLVTGPHPVELDVEPRVARVEVLLDGRPVATLAAPPWRADVDLGEALMPHELLAVARDETGAELARARRWINIDMPKVEIAGRAPPGGLTPLPVVLTDGRLVTTEEVSGWFSLDGEPLEVRAMQSGLAEVIVVQDPATQHGLEEMARLYLAHELGRLGFSQNPPRADSPDREPELLRMPEDEFLQAAAAVFGASDRAPDSRQISRLWQSYHQFAHLGEDTKVRFLSPLAAPISRSDRERNLFMQSEGIADMGLFWLAGKLPPMSFAYRFADAVAIAGREAHAVGRRRAVLLLLQGEPSDDSLLSPAVVRDYLRALRVPLFVWTFSATGELPGWGEPRFVGLRASGKRGALRAGALAEGFERFAAATAELRRAVERQRIVWLTGERPPHQIELSDDAAGARPAGLEPQDNRKDAARNRHGATGGGAG